MLIEIKMLSSVKEYRKLEGDRCWLQEPLLPGLNYLPQVKNHHRAGGLLLNQFKE